MAVAFAILFGLLSMFAYGFANAYSQPLSRRLGPAQTLFLRGFTISVVLGLVAIPSFHYLSNWLAVIATICLGVAGYLPVLAFTHGIKESKLGIVAPIAGTSPLVTVLLSFAFLHIFVHQLQWLAIALVILANIVVSVDTRNWRQSNILQLSTGVPYAIIAALGWGF